MGRSGAALVLLVALVAAGVVGMHTLGLHGTAHGGHDAAAPAGAAAPAVPAVAADAHGPAAHGEGHRAASPDGQPPSADPVAAACLFLLVLGALAALLAPVLRRLPRGWLPLPRPGGPRVVVRALVACTRPPPTWEHSVVRC